MVTTEEYIRVQEAHNKRREEMRQTRKEKFDACLSSAREICCMITGKLEVPDVMLRNTAELVFIAWHSPDTRSRFKALAEVNSMLGLKVDRLEISRGDDKRSVEEKTQALAASLQRLGLVGRVGADNGG